MEKITYSHGARIRLLEIDRWSEHHYVIQEWIPEFSYSGWHNRDAPCPASDKQKAIEMFNRYQRDGFPHPAWDVEYMHIGDCRVIMQGVVEDKKIEFISRDLCDAFSYVLEAA